MLLNLDTTDLLELVTSTAASLNCLAQVVNNNAGTITLVAPQLTAIASTTLDVHDALIGTLDNLRGTPHG